MWCHLLQNAPFSFIYSFIYLYLGSVWIILELVTVTKFHCIFKNWVRAEWSEKVLNFDLSISFCICCGITVFVQLWQTRHRAVPLWYEMLSIWLSFWLCAKLHSAFCMAGYNPNSTPIGLRGGGIENLLGLIPRGGPKRIPGQTASAVSASPPDMNFICMFYGRKRIARFRTIRSDSDVYSLGQTRYHSAYRLWTL